MPGTFVPAAWPNTPVSAAWGVAVSTAITELQPGPWINFPFTAPWTNWSGWQACQYRKIGDTVYLRGLSAKNNASGSIIGVLPAGYRPSARVDLTTYTDAGWSFLVAEADGNLWFSPGPSAAGWAALNNLRFGAAQW